MSHSAGSDSPSRTPLFHGLFRLDTGADGSPRVTRHSERPPTIPCPDTGRHLRIGTLDTGAPAICPSCTQQGHGGFVSFVGDLRMAYACPQCREFIWLAGV
jgi:hypothetical protein